MNEDQQRKRVSKACDACRSKKIKCDGTEPCFHCIKVGCACTYSHVVKKRLKPPTRISNRKIMSDLSDRLTRLEDILTQIRDGSASSESSSATLVDESALLNVESQHVSAESLSASESDSGTDTIESDGTLSTRVPGRTSEVDLCGGWDTGTCCAPKGSAGIGPGSVSSTVKDGEDMAHSSLDPNKCEHYLNAYSAFSLFTRRGLYWVHQKLNGGSDLMGSLIQVKAAICSNNFINFDLYFDRIGLIDTYDFPSTDTCETLFQNFLTYAVPVAPLDIESEIPAIKEKFDLSPRTLNYSELFLVNTVLLIGSTIECQKLSIKNENNARWLMIQTQMMLKTLQLYQQTSLTFANDTLLYIKGVFLFCWQVENSPTPQLAYLFLSTAVRLAQEIGLHLRESYQALTDSKEASARHSLWQSLYRYDIYISIRTGKPTSIHDEDTSVLDDWDYYRYMNANLKGTKLDLQSTSDPYDSKNWLSELDSNLRVSCFKSRESLNFALKYYELKLGQNSSKSYKFLLTCRALAESNYKRRAALVEKLNRGLDEWRSTVPSFLKVANCLDDMSKLDNILENMPERSPESGPWTSVKSSVASLKLRILNLETEYYLSMLYTNCVLYRTPWNKDSLFHSSGRDLRPTKDDRCAFAARMMLKLAQATIETQNPSTTLRGNILYSFFSGFLNLFYRCIENCTAAKEDLRLLYDTTLLVNETAKSQRNIHSLKWTVVVFTCLSFLKLGVLNFQAETNDESLTIDPDVIQNELKALLAILAVQPQETLLQLRIIDEFHNNLRSVIPEQISRTDLENGAPRSLSSWVDGDLQASPLISKMDAGLAPEESLGTLLNDIYGLAPNQVGNEEVGAGGQDFDFTQFFAADDLPFERRSMFHF
ncbi:LADA_0D02366g1_1 [Lachancea dasiensis]|uniref:LADA_0D02366g1_1 n=1 Tax=Lachancea dasiensis TaxID=1072105 RepID=A0A1G4J4U4_9SACH|nr:LADA_0D02366g1_1 [Lachancea dasiensis]